MPHDALQDPAGALSQDEPRRQRSEGVALRCRCPIASMIAGCRLPVSCCLFPRRPRSLYRLRDEEVARGRSHRIQPPIEPFGVLAACGEAGRPSGVPPAPRSRRTGFAGAGALVDVVAFLAVAFDDGDGNTRACSARFFVDDERLGACAWRSECSPAPIGPRFCLLPSALSRRLIHRRASLRMKPQATRLDWTQAGRRAPLASKPRFAAITIACA